MKTVALPTISHPGFQTKPIAIALFAGVLVLTALYVYFLVSAVAQIVIGRELAYAITIAESEISQLESKYIAAQHEVSDVIARQSTFTDSTDKIFVEREQSATLVLSTLVQ